MKSKDILYIIIIIAICTFFMNDCSRDALIEREKITISDTIYSEVKINDTSYQKVILKDTIYQPHYVKVSIPLPNKNDSLRHYTGIYNMDFGNIIWSADVSGFLEEISFSGEAEIPQINQTKIGTVTKTVEITKLPRWNLYGGMHGIVSPVYYELGPSVDLRIGKVKYGYGYGILNKSHLINIQATIF